MASPRDIRRLALLALYQLDASPETECAHLRESIEDLDSLAEEGLVLVDGITGVSSKNRDEAVAKARGAWEARAEADAELTALAPDWPTSRQAAVDRAILRLAWYEMSTKASPPKAVVNEAVELAKQFSTDKSPAFVNALLGKVLKRLQGEPVEPVRPDAIEPDGPVVQAPDAQEG
jgi:N utilization substance protein B